MFLRNVREGLKISEAVGNKRRGDLGARVVLTSALAVKMPYVCML